MRNVSTMQKHIPVVQVLQDDVSCWMMPLKTCTGREKKTTDLAFHVKKLVQSSPSKKKSWLHGYTPFFTIGHLRSQAPAQEGLQKGNAFLHNSVRSQAPA